MELNEVFARRRSIRSYTGEAVTEEQVKEILAAADFSPVGRAKYETVHLTCVQDKAMLALIEKDIASKFDNGRGAFLYNAPYLIIISSNANDNLAYSNCAIIAQNMVLAATNLGLGACHNWCCAMAIATNAALLQKLAIPANFKPACAIVFGKTNEGLPPRELVKDRITKNFV